MPQLALLLSSCCLSLRASAICCFNDGAHISNYTAQRCLSTLTFINIPLVPPGATDFTPLPPPHPWKIYCCCCLRLQFSLKQNPLCSWLTRFRKKLISADRCCRHHGDSRPRRRPCHHWAHPRLPVASVIFTIATDQTDRLQTGNIKAFLELKVFDLGQVSSDGARGRREMSFSTPRLLSQRMQMSEGLLGPDSGGRRGQRLTSLARRGVS